MIASGVMPGAQQRERLRAVAHIDDRLRRGDADIGFGPEHAVADREDARLHGPAELAGRRVVAEDGKRACPERVGSCAVGDDDGDESRMAG